MLDGEIVAFDERGLPSFERLQKRMHLTSASAIARAAREIPVTYAIFDLLYLDGHPTIELPYGQRRELLEGLRLKGPAWQVPAQRESGGAELLAATAAQGLEGVIAKRLDSPYRPGERSGEWVKIKNVRRQEFVIGGWLPGKEGRSGQPRRAAGRLPRHTTRRLTGTATALRRPRRHRLRRARAVPAGTGARGTRPSRQPIRRARRPAAAGGALRGARAGGRDRVLALDARSHPAPLLLQGPAHRQAGGGGDA